MRSLPASLRHAVVGVALTLGGGVAAAGSASAPCTAADSTLAACTDADVEAATAVLSQNYAQVWARLPAGERAAFAAREKRWLASERWQEKDACVAGLPSAGAARDTACLAQVTLRRAETLTRL